ncbi:MAG: TlpA disulfide reductase family protein [Burkholderiaceae bacterium]
MNEAIVVGPFVLSTTTLLTGASLGLGWVGGRWLLRDADRSMIGRLTRAFVVAIVAARVAFVVEWLDAYLAHPIDIVDVSDGGWNVPFGLLGGWLYTLAVRPGGAGRNPHATRRIQAALATSLLLFVAGTAALHMTAGVQKRLALQALNVTDGAGAPTTLAAFGGRPLVVNLWATWCGPCRREMPMLARAQDAHPEIVFVFVNQGEDERLIARYLADARLALRNSVRDTGSQVARAIALQGWPTTVWLAADGRVLAIDVGALSPVKLEQRLAELVK